MKKITLLFLLLFLFQQQLFAQLFEKRINWNLSTVDFAQVTACGSRSNGNNLIAIRQSYQTGQGAAALIELSTNGDTIWTKKFNRAGTSYGENYITFIKELPNNGIFMAGFTHSSSGFYHAALWLADSVGNITNYKQFAYNTYREITINDIDVADDGSIYFAGNYFDLFSGGVTYYSWTVPLYGKLNPDLTLAWGKTWGSTNHINNNNNRGNVVGIKVAPDNNVIVLGSDAVDFNHGYLGTMQLAKVTPGGVIIWNKQRDMYNNNYIKALSVGSIGEIYAITEFYTSTSNGNNHVIEKFNTNGDFIWAKEIGSSLTESYSDMEYNPYNNTLALSGSYTTANNVMALETTIDTSGTVLQSKIFGETVSTSNYFIDVLCTSTNLIFAGNCYTFGGLLVQSDHSGNTGCVANSVNLQSINFTPNPYTQGIYHSGMNFTFTDYNTNYISNPISSTQSCYSCANVTISQSINACQSYYVGGSLQFSSGLYYDTLSTTSGCDSIIVTNLTIYQNPSIANAGSNQNICNNAASINANIPTVGAGMWSVISGNGNIVNVNDPTTGINNLSLGENILRWTIINGSCTSSFDEVSIFVGTPTSSTINENSCDSITINNNTYFTSGNYTQTLVNAAGCDSTLYINLTISNSSNYNFSDLACNTYTFNNQTYTQSGTYTQILQNTLGCDSIITLNLIISNADTSAINVSTCNEDYILNNQTYSSSGTYTQLLQTVAGCDSTIIIELVINPAIDTTISVSGITLSSNQSNAQYQWWNCSLNSLVNGANSYDFTPGINGDYAVIINNNGCVDTSACYGIYTVGGIEHQNLKHPEIIPNPSNGMFKVLGNFKNAQLLIYNISGDVVYKDTNFQSNSSIDFSAQESGIYFLKIHIETSEISKRILIIK